MNVKSNRNESYLTLFFLEGGGSCIIKYSPITGFIGVSKKIPHFGFEINFLNGRQIQPPAPSELGLTSPQKVYFVEERMYCIS